MMQKPWFNPVERLSNEHAPNGFSEREIHLGIWEWKHRTRINQEVDSILEPFLNCPPSGPGLRSMRKAHLLSMQTLADRLGISVSGYRSYERNEVAGTITLKTLSQCAEALDCELVYAIRPKSRKKTADLLWEAIFPHLKRHRWVKLWSLAKEKLYSPEFRRQMGWAPERYEAKSGIWAADP